MYQKCLHCQKLAPAWDQLAADWKDKTSTALIAKVDCTQSSSSSEGGKKLCDKFRVSGFPTIKYGDPKALQDYNGGRSYHDMAAFTTAQLKPPCSVETIESCDETTKQELLDIMKNTNDEILALIQQEKQKLNDANHEFKIKTKELEQQYNVMVAEKDRKIKEIKESGLDTAKLIKAFKETKQGYGSKGEEL
jgi:thiol-disulfide isomerase/thioredoxin